jgi:signal recognition particle subunit SRP54
MFDSLSKKLVDVFERLRGRGALTEKDLDVVLREIRIALLEADVALPAVKALLEGTKKKAIGQEILKGVTPSQMIIKSLYDEIVALLGTDVVPLNTHATSPFSYLFVGLQGSGKTTTVAKIARKLKDKHKILLVSLDVYRPAAFKQLEILAQSLQIPFFPGDITQSPVEIAKQAMNFSKKTDIDIVFFDTAGRTQTDPAMMKEAHDLYEALNPLETLLVADSLMGQEAVHLAQAFHQNVPLSGLILTRADGDAKGGAALSMRFITNAPIKWLGTGEALDKIIPFDPHRIADRILDRGDVVELVEAAKRISDESEIEKLTKRIEKGKFNLNDFKIQLEQMKKLGGLSWLM